MARYRKYLEFAGLLLLAVAILWWFGRRLDWQQVKAALQNSDWRLILAAGLVILAAYLWRALRWRALLAPVATTSVREIWIATTVGFGAVLLVGRAGEVVRPVVLPMRDPRVRPAAAFVTIMVERLYDITAVILLFALNLLWFQPSGSTSNEIAHMREAGLLLVLVLLLALGLLTLFRRRSQVVIGWLDRKIRARSSIGERLKRALLSTLEQLAAALRVLSDARELAITIGWSVALWFSVALANLIVFRAFGLRFLK